MNILKKLFKGKPKDVSTLADDFTKARKVISSCKTSIQLNTAQNYIGLVQKKHVNDPGFTSVNNQLMGMYESQFEKLEG